MFYKSYQYLRWYLSLGCLFREKIKYKEFAFFYENTCYFEKSFMKHFVKKLLAALRKSSITLKTAPEAACDPKNSSEKPPLARKYIFSGFTRHRKRD
jgi:hypothetical protein